MRIPKRTSRGAVARATYTGILVSPLKAGDAPASKLPALIEALDVTTFREGIAAMLVAHVIGHNARDYPLELRGTPVRGPSAKARVPLLLKHFGASSDRDGLLAMAVRHLPGFRPAVEAAVGRKSSIKERGFDRNAFDAELEDEYYARLKDARKQGKSLSQPQWARFACAAAANDPKDPLYGVKPKQLVQWLSERGRRDKRLEKESAERVARFRAVAGLPPLKR